MLYSMEYRIQGSCKDCTLRTKKYKIIMYCRLKELGVYNTCLQPLMVIAICNIHKVLHRYSLMPELMCIIVFNFYNSRIIKKTTYLQFYWNTGLNDTVSRRLTYVLFYPYKFSENRMVYKVIFPLVFPAKYGKYRSQSQRSLSSSILYIVSKMNYLN